MSPSIWTQCAGDSEVRPRDWLAWRAVEAQHVVSTRKLVDTLDEQALLEQLIDRAKPPDPTGGRRHVLVATPFRYPPLAHGSRFGQRHERGIWYGSATRRALFAEVAYYRFVFLQGTRAPLEALTTWHTVFRMRLRTRRGVDLTAPPFAAHRAAIRSPVDYTSSQALGAAMRGASVEAFRYPSARDVQDGVNLGAFTPDVFGTRGPQGLETWHCLASRQRVELVRPAIFESDTFTFPREDFLVDGVLPAPAVG